MSNALTGAVAAFYKGTGAAATSFSAEIITDQGDHKHYHQPDISKQNWEENVLHPLTVEKQTGGEGDWVTVSSGFTVVYAIGQLIFSVANGATDKIRVSGYRDPIGAVAYANGYTLNGKLAALGVTPLGVTDEEFIPGNWSGELKVSTFLVLPGHLDDLGEELIILAFVDTGANKSRFYGRGVCVDASRIGKTGQPVTEDLSFKVTGVLTEYTVAAY